MADHRVEIWQCDMNGKYLHGGFRRSIEFDAAFQGFGHDITGPDGSYKFRTIKPVTYPGRTPHIDAIEAEIGTKIFLRHARGYALTERSSSRCLRLLPVS